MPPALKRTPLSLALCSLFCLGLARCGSSPSGDPGKAGRPAQAQVPPPAARILVNQVGYEPGGAKKAVIQGSDGDSFASFTVRSFPGGETVLSGLPVHAGPVAKWKGWDFWTVDWSAVTAEGAYIIEVAGGANRAGASADPSRAASSFPDPAPLLRSQPILVRKNALTLSTLSDVLYYFKGQRSSGLWDKADRTMTFEGRPGVVDVHGGWFDATGDYGKHLSHLSYSTYFNPQQISLAAWGLFTALREIERRDGPALRQYRKRLLDEALFGADYLVRVKDPRGSFYITVSGRGPEKKPEDRRIAPKAGRHIILTPDTKDKFRDYGRERIAGDAAYEAGYREGAGLGIAALAMAAARGGPAGAPGSEGYGMSRGEGDFAATDYLKAAEDAFAFLEKNNLTFTNDGRENIVDDYCALVAAVELYRTTRKPVYMEAADRRAASLEARSTSWTSRGGAAYENYWRADGPGGDRPFFHPVDAGLPVVALVAYAEVADGPARARALEAVRKSLAFELAISGEVANPFGYSRQLVQSKDGAASRRSAFFFPHDTETAPWWQGENARLGSMAAAAGLAARSLSAAGLDGTAGEAGPPGVKPPAGPVGSPGFAGRLRAFGRAQLDWILGLNPYDACMLQGHGRNNIAYMFFDSPEYTNAPGGICNGVTGGYADGDVDGIDFGLRYAQTGKDDDWRWAEQWLPHAAWYLVAVSIGE
ncbi:MAG: glycoside hydrolase family 9 protein [Acidobacteriota bacterium]